MVSARNRNAGAYDFWLTHSASGSAVQQGFVCADDPESGLLAYRPGIAPMLAPQFRSSGFTYAHRPPEIDLPLAFRGWGGGSGVEQLDTSAGQLIESYHYSQGIDASRPGRLLPSPAKQTMGTIGNNVLQYLLSDEHGIFLITPSAVFEKTGVSTWTSRQAVSAGAQYTSLFEYSNATDTYLLAAQGDLTPANYRVSTDGTTWTVASGTNADVFAYFATRVSAAGAQVVWGITEAGALRNTQDPSATGAWSAADQITQPRETVLGMATGPDNVLYIATDIRLYSYDGTTITELVEFADLKEVLTVSDRRSVLRTPAGLLFIMRERALFKYDTSAAELTVVWPPKEPSSVLTGRVRGLAASVDHVFFSLDVGTTGSYIMQGDPTGSTWHTLTWIAESTSVAALIVAASDLYGSAFFDTDTRTLAVGTNQPYFYSLAHAGDIPTNDSAYSYETTAGTIYGPWVDFGAQTFKKLITEAELVAENIAADETATLKIELEDDQGTETTLITANATGFLYTGSASSALEFTRARYVLTLDYTAGDPPIVRGFAIHAAPLPPRKRTWQMDVLLGAAQRGGGQGRYAPSEQETFLFNALDERCTFGARDGTAYTVRVLDLEYAGVKRYQGKDHPVIRVSMVQI